MFIGLNVVPNICADTFVAFIWDVLICMKLILKYCRGQCYDGTSNMSGVKSGVTTQIKAGESGAIFSHCYGHSLQLAVVDMIKKVKDLKDTLDTTFKISKLLRFSPKRGTLFKKLKKDLTPEFPGFGTLYPTRCTVHGGSLQSVINNWNVLQELGNKCLETKPEPDIKGCIIRAKDRMGTFDYFYRVNLGGMLLKHSDNLSRAIKTSHMSGAECQLVAALTIKTLIKVRAEEDFSLFRESYKKAATELKINEPVLPCKK